MIKAALSPLVAMRVWSQPASPSLSFSFTLLPYPSFLFPRFLPFSLFLHSSTAVTRLNDMATLGHSPPEYSSKGEKNGKEMVGESYAGDHGAETELKRILGTRHLTMIALGSSIGMGLWLGSGKSLNSGGPAAIFIGYLLSGSMIWAVSHSIGEMAVMYPLPSAFVQWTGIFVDPAAGFTLGWAYWISYWITIANELQVSFTYVPSSLSKYADSVLQGVVTVLSFWTDKVPTAAWITIFWLAIIFVNIWVVSFFAEIEVVASFIKFTWIFVVIISFIGKSLCGCSLLRSICPVNHKTTSLCPVNDSQVLTFVQSYPPVVHPVTTP